MRQYINALTEAGRRGAAWVLTQVGERGDLSDAGELGSHYKCVIPLRLAGYATVAAKVLDFIIEKFGMENGDLRNSPEVKTAGSYTSHFCQAYPNGWVVLGAVYLGRIDIVHRLMAAMMSEYYDEDMGTFRSCILPRVDEYDIVSAAMAAELLLYTDIGKAKRAGDFMLRHIENQPDLEHWYYTRVDKSFKYLTEPNPISEIYSAYQIGAEGQAQWFVGFPAAVLVHLYQATGEERFLKGADHFLDTFLASGEVVFHAYGSGKAMWCASMLYRLTRKKKYLNIVLRVADFIMSLQQDDGSFAPRPEDDAVKSGLRMLLDMTPDYTRWCYETATELSVCVQ